MKSKTLAALTIIIGLALSASVFAQGRHDEKPHGSGKPVVVKNEQAGNPALPGRHDERPHGIKRPAAQKDGAKAGEGADKGSK